MRSIHDMTIEAMIRRLKSEGREAFDNHNLHNRKITNGRIPDIIASNPDEWYEIEVLNKQALPKTDGVRRTLIIVGPLEWDNVQMLSDDDLDLRKIEPALWKLDLNLEKIRLETQRSHDKYMKAKSLQIKELDEKIEERKKVLTWLVEELQNHKEDIQILRNGLEGTGLTSSLCPRQRTARKRS